MQETETRPDARIREIMARPVWRVEDICIAFSIAPGTIEKVLREHPITGMFSIGRVRHVRQDDAMRWLSTLPKHSPRINNRSKVAA